MTADQWLTKTQDEAERHVEANKSRYWEMFRSLRNAREQGREDVLRVVRAVLPATEADHIESRVREATTVEWSERSGGPTGVPHPTGHLSDHSTAAVRSTSGRKDRATGHVGS